MMAVTYGLDELTEEQYLSAKATAWNNAAPARAFAALREKRDQLLVSSDWTQASDTALSDDKVAEWIFYRDKLRKLPAQYDNSSIVGAITWPTKPE